jgi:ribosomal protein S18 acetylase RimI-like enzyme
VITHEDAIVAASVLIRGRPTSALASLAVAPSYRQRGLGRWLVADAIARSRRADAAWLSLEVDCSNAGAVRLYRRQGFGTLRRFCEEGVRRLELVRRLGGARGR